MSEMEIVILAEIFTEATSGFVGSLVATTGLTGAAARYGTVLAGGTAREVEQATAIGFFSGLGSGVLALLMEVMT
jgi:hypothetical protein